MSSGSVVAVIPARFASSRFPGKPLALLAGRPMIQHVHARCLEAGVFAQVIVATDDDRIEQAARAFGADCVRTSEACPSGTDRVAEVARALPDVERFVNVQGDEPLVPPAALRELCEAICEPGVRMATLVRPLEEPERKNPNVVKAVLARSGDALYFSRADLPFVRDVGCEVTRYGHVGLYAYTRSTLLQLAALPPTPLEQAERLEQLRALEHGIPIRCRVTAFRSVGVDTPEDLARAERLLSLGPPPAGRD